jgi:hypothetical protein
MFDVPSWKFGTGHLAKRDCRSLHFPQSPEGKILVTKFEFGGSFGMSLQGDCHDIEVTPNLEL